MKRNVAGQKVGAQLVSATDGSAFTGSVTVAVTGDAGTQATGSVGSGACTHEGGGYHTYAPAQAETDYALVAFTFSGTGAVPVTVQIYTSFPQTGDSYARLGAPAGADIATDIAALPTAAENADAVWDEARSGHVTAGTFGGDAVDAPPNFDALAIDVSGNLTGSVASVVGAVGSVTGNVGGNVAGSVASVTAGVTLDASAVDAIWDELQSGHTTAGTFGKYLDAAVSGVSTGGVSAADIADAVWDEARSGHVAAGTFGEGVASVQGNLTGSVASVTAAVTVGTNNDKTGYSLSSAGIQAIWDALTSALTTVGSIGKLLVDNINATISSRLAGASYTAPLDAAGVRSAVGLASANLDTQLAALPTASEINAEVVDALTTDTYAEPSGAPGATVSLKDKIGFIYQALRNKLTITSSAKTFHNDAGTAQWSKSLSDDGSTYTEAEGS